MESENITTFKDFATRYNNFSREYENSFFPEPSELMDYLRICSGKVIVIGSRPGQGKTSLMLSLIKEGPQCPVLIFTLENSSQQLLNRFMRMTGEVNDLSLAECAVKDYKSDRCLINTERNFSVYDSSSLTFAKFLSVIEHQQSVSPVNVVFIDYYQLLNNESPNLLYKIKTCAKMFNVTIVAISQLERSVDRNPLEIPTLESFPRLHDSENIDEAYYLVRPKLYNLPKEEGSSLENAAILSCLKGKFESYRMIFNFNDLGGAFQKIKV